VNVDLWQPRCPEIIVGPVALRPHLPVGLPFSVVLFYSDISEEMRYSITKIGNLQRLHKGPEPALVTAWLARLQRNTKS